MKGCVRSQARHFDVQIRSLPVIPTHSSHLLLHELCSQDRSWCACPLMVTSVTHSGWALLKVVSHATAIGCKALSLMSLVNKINFLFMF